MFRTRVPSKSETRTVVMSCVRRHVTPMDPLKNYLVPWWHVLWRCQRCLIHGFFPCQSSNLPWVHSTICHGHNSQSESAHGSIHSWLLVMAV